jgi:tRNA threonylcarbamoyladenosine biosynthesis protein TsaE
MHIATKSSKIDISLENNTRLISNEISHFLKKGDIFFLYGEIGVGKSTFIKYLINFLQSKSNMKQAEVPSPTFNIVNEYKTKDFIIHQSSPFLSVYFSGYQILQFCPIRI